MGLLDDPNMAAAMGLLSAGGFSRNPVSIGQAIGQGYQSAQEQQQQALKRRMMEQGMQMQGVQMQGMQAQMEAQKAAQAQRDAFRSTLPPEYRTLPDNLLDEYLRSTMKPPEKPQLVTVEGPDGKPMQKWIRPGEAQGVDIGAAPSKEAALPWYVRKGEAGLSIDPAYAELEKTKAAYGRPPAQPMAPVAYINDSGQTVWGTIAEAKGKPAANFSPTLQGQIAGAKEGAKTFAEETTKARIDAPRVVDNANLALKYSDELLKHPGFKQAVGASSMLGIQKIPGTDAKDFMNRLDQLKGGAFLEAFNTLKGGGQITEVEGKKATDAIARMDNATSEGEFRAAVKDYQDVIRRGMNRAKMKANPVAPVSQPDAGGVKFLGFE